MEQPRTQNMNTDKLIDWLIEAYRNHKSPPASPSNCVALVEKLKDPARMQDLIEESKIEFHNPLAPKEFGDFVILGPLGAGGMGEVFRVRHKKLNRIQALKLLPSHRIENQQASRRFEREMQAIGQLQHPNIVTVHDAGLLDGTPFLAMELIDGQSLAQLVRAHKKNRTTIQTKHAVEIITQAAKGVEHAHQNNVIHRDIKPANLMIDRSGVVKLLDLGLAKVKPAKTNYAVQSQSLDSIQLTGQQILGTPDFMAPEQISGEVDERSDIYALGATLYFLLTGQVLFPKANSSLIHKALAIVNEVAPPVAKLRTDVSDSLGQAIARSLNKDIATRQQTVAEFINEIQVATAAFKETVADKYRNTFSESTSPKPMLTKPGEANNTAQDNWATSNKDAHSTADAGPRPPATKSSASITSTASPLFNWTKVGFFALLPFALILLGIFLFKGPVVSILRVECDDPNVIVEAEWIGDDKAKPTDAIVQLGEQTENGRNKKLKIGSWKLSIKGDLATKFTVSKNQIELIRGEETVVQVTAVRVPDPQPQNAIIVSGTVVAVSKSGKWLILRDSESDHHQIVERKTQRVVGSFQAISDAGLNWDADETKLMAAGKSGRLMHVAIVSIAGEVLHRWSIKNTLYAEMSPDGDRILFHAGRLRMTDLAGKPVPTFIAPEDSFRAWANVGRSSSWSPDGSKFAFYDEPASEVLIYGCDGGAPNKRVQVPQRNFYQFSWLRSSNEFATSHHVYDLEGNARPLHLSQGFHRVFSPDESQWVSTDGTISTASGRTLVSKDVFEDGFLVWESADVFLSIDSKNPGRYREISTDGTLVRDITPSD